MLLKRIHVSSFLLCISLRSVAVLKAGPQKNSLAGATKSVLRDMAELDVKQRLSSRVRRILAVEGDCGKSNDVIFISGGTKPESNQHVVYFGGDVQDYTENMEFHRDNRRYVQWNLETTAEILQERFPHNHIWVVKPAKMQLKTFSIYSNFVISDDGGCPDHSTGQSSWLHLVKLLKTAASKIDDNLLHAPPFKSDTSFNLIGFSKGCVVLNQLLYDLDDGKKDEETASFLRMVKNMYWLDGGHAGGSNTYVTDTSVLASLIGTGITVKCFVTPYQVNDSNRKWIAKEHRKFIQELREMSHPVEDSLLFEDRERSIENHFSILLEFK